MFKNDLLITIRRSLKHKRYDNLKAFACLFLIAFSSMAYSQGLTKIWETDTLFNKPESAVFDDQNQIIYVSNINGKYRTKDGNGFISKVDLSGNILELKWLEGLDSPQGLAIHKNNLYVADLDRVVEIDISKAQISHVFKIDSALFLNDVTTDSLGCVYISDCVGNKIYKIENDDVNVWLVDSLLKGPNGLLISDRGLFVLNMGNGLVYLVDMETKLLTKFCEGIRNCDGITGREGDGFFVSGAWQGEIYDMDLSGRKSLLLDLGKEGIITADIDYIADKQMLLIPTLKKTLIAYKWNE